MGQQNWLSFGVLAVRVTVVWISEVDTNYHTTSAEYVIFEAYRVRKKTYVMLLLDFSLTVKAATLIFISGCVSAI